MIGTLLNCHSGPACAGRRSNKSAFSLTVATPPACHSERSEESAFSVPLARTRPLSLFQLAAALLVLLVALLPCSLAQTSPAPFPGPAPANLPQDFIGKTGDFGNQTQTDVLILLELSNHLYQPHSA